MDAAQAEAAEQNPPVRPSGQAPCTGKGEFAAFFGDPQQLLSASCRAFTRDLGRHTAIFWRRFAKV